VKDKLSAIIKALTDGGLEATRLSDETSPCVVSEFMSTGSAVLDAAMGGGLPVGRIVEIYGDTSTGKSLIAAQACATIQQEGGLALYLDTESAVSLPIMEAVGVDIDNIAYSAPDTVEEVFLAMERAIEAKDPDTRMLIVWDSIASTSSDAEMDKATGEVGYLMQSRIISQGLRKLARKISKSSTACLFLNQEKEKIGIMFGDKAATFGGRGVGFHSSIRVQLSVDSKLKDKNKRVIGILVGARVVKNKVAVPFRVVKLPVYFGMGIDDAEAALILLKSRRLVTYEKGMYTLWGGPEFKRDEWDDLYYTYETMGDLIDVAVGAGDLT
jgi:recombination protein RecA